MVDDDELMEDDTVFLTYPKSSYTVTVHVIAIVEPPIHFFDDLIEDDEGDCDNA